MPGTRDLLAEIGRIAVSFQAAPDGVSGRVWAELRPWFLRLAVHAAPKWLPRLSFGFPCAVPVYESGEPIGPCPGAAIAACDVCGQPCCLNHARIDQFGDAICYLCVAEAHRQRRARPRPRPGKPPPGPADLAWARKVLRVKPDTEWEEVRAAHRRLSGKWHPDRKQGDAEKEKAAERFKEIQRAFEVLSRAREAA